MAVPRRPLRSFLGALLFAFAWVVPTAAAVPSSTPFAGLELARALDRLRTEGLALVYSTALVKPSMIVAVEPPAGSSRARLAALLAPHGLAAVDAPRGRMVIVAAPRPAARERAATIEATPAITSVEEEIEVTTARRESLHGEPVAGVDTRLLPADRDLPHADGDLFRAIGLLPGARVSESSSRLSVRGSRSEDVQVIFDGLELLASYHLPEFDSALAIVPSEALASAELISDPAPAEYGDRIGGVLDLRSRNAAAPLAVSLGIGSSLAEADLSGGLGRRSGGWLVSLRAGSYKLALEVDGRGESPRYADLFGKLELEPRPGQTLGLRFLSAEDRYSSQGAGLGGGEYDGRWGNSYVWLEHVAMLGPQAYLDSFLASGLVDRERNAADAVQGSLRFALDDRRDLRMAAARSALHVSPRERPWSFDLGLELRQLRSVIDYSATRESVGMPLPGASTPAEEIRFFRDEEFMQNSGFASWRTTAHPEWTIETGLRFDRLGQTDEQHWNPRLHLAWRPGERLTARAAWGRYTQSQRPYELQVEDGETRLAPAEQSTQSLLSIERELAGGALWRIGLFERRERRLRSRFESLFDTAALYPELAPGRVLVAPTAGRASGVELSLRDDRAGVLDWALDYTFARVVDRIDDRWVPRATGETHAVRLTATRALPRGWTMSAVGLFHSGWPTTAIDARVEVDADGVARATPVQGPLRAERLPDYHRLDLRLGRSWQAGRGRLEAWLDLQNLYDRENARGLADLSFSIAADGSARVDARRVSWGGFRPSFGLRWSF